MVETFGPYFGLTSIGVSNSPLTDSLAAAYFGMFRDLQQSSFGLEHH
jgi:hypothetical protein